MENGWAIRTKQERRNGEVKLRTGGLQRSSEEIRKLPEKVDFGYCEWAGRVF